MLELFGLQGIEKNNLIVIFNGAISQSPPALPRPCLFPLDSVTYLQKHTSLTDSTAAREFSKTRSAIQYVLINRHLKTTLWLRLMKGIRFK